MQLLPPRVLVPTTLLIVALIAVVVYFLWPPLSGERTDDAYIEAHVVTVMAKLPAYVKAVRVDDNVKVKAGQVMVELDDRDYVVQLELAKANLAAAESKEMEAESKVAVVDATVAQAQAQLASARANHGLATINLKRLRSVGDSRAVSTERIDTADAASSTTQADVAGAESRMAQAKADTRLVRAALATAKASVAQAKAAVDQAQLNLSYTKIVAQEDGAIANKSVEDGNFVQPGQSLLSLVPETVYVIANFKETQLSYIKPGETVTISVDALEKQLKGHVDTIQRGTGSVFALLPPENATGNFVKVVQRVPVKILLDEPPETLAHLAPGMSVEVRVHVTR